MGSKSGFSRWAAGLGLGVLLVQASACGMTVKRDLSASKPGVVVFDDMCGLQNYFDALHDSTIATPREVFAQDLADENGKAAGGTARYRFETEFQLHHLRQLLTTNWGGLPDEVGKASALDLEVRWSEKATVKRVVTNETAVLAAGEKKWDLPYHVCLSDLLFGEQLYNTRRTVLQLPPPPRSPFSKKPAGAPKAATDGTPVVALAPAEAPAPAAAATEAPTPAPTLVPAAAMTPAPVATPETPPAPGAEPASTK
jgi:hypothetical protein